MKIINHVYDTTYGWAKMDKDCVMFKAAQSVLFIRQSSLRTAMYIVFKIAQSV